MMASHATALVFGKGEPMIPKEEPNPNGQKPPESLFFERSEVICRRCNRKFEHFVIEEIDNLAQLRCGDVLISITEMF
jgi:hypothetical protein